MNGRHYFDFTATFKWINELHCFTICSVCRVVQKLLWVKLPSYWYSNSANPSEAQYTFYRFKSSWKGSLLVPNINISKNLIACILLSNLCQVYKYIASAVLLLNQHLAKMFLRVSSITYLKEKFHVYTKALNGTEV